MYWSGRYIFEDPRIELHHGKREIDIPSMQWSKNNKWNDSSFAYILPSKLFKTGCSCLRFFSIIFLRFSCVRNGKLSFWKKRGEMVIWVFIRKIKDLKRKLQVSKEVIVSLTKQCLCIKGRFGIASSQRGDASMMRWWVSNR